MRLVLAYSVPVEVTLVGAGVIGPISPIVWFCCVPPEMFAHDPSAAGDANQPVPRELDVATELTATKNAAGADVNRS